MASPTFVQDDSRKYALNAIERHIKKRRQSILLTGNYGSGKSDLLKQVKRQSDYVTVRSLGCVYEILARIAGKKDAFTHLKSEYLDFRCNHPTVIFIDEAHELPKGIYPYLKILIDAGNVFILAGLPELQAKIWKGKPDVLSRMTAITLEPLSQKDLYPVYQDKFEPDAFSAIYGHTTDMRMIRSIAESCLDYIEENKQPKVTAETTLKFLPQID